MTRHRRRMPTMTDAERDRFLEAATALHKACCAPLLAPMGEQSRALSALNQTIVETIRTVTGRDPHWMAAAPAGRITGTY